MALKRLQVSLSFDDSRHIGFIDIDERTLNMSNINEYILAPAFHYDKSSGQFVIDEYGLIHVGLMMPLDKIKEASDQLRMEQPL